MTMPLGRPDIGIGERSEGLGVQRLICNGVVAPPVLASTLKKARA